MEFSKILEKRRSIRKFLPVNIDKPVLNQLFLSAQQAPSWKNSQTARYYIVTNKEILDILKNEAIDDSNKPKVTDCPCFIITTFVKNRSGFDRQGNAENEIGNGWGIYDAAMQHQNLINEATQQNLGTLIIGLRDITLLSNLLSIPEEETILSIIAIGYYTEQPLAPKRKDIESICHYFE